MNRKEIDNKIVSDLALLLVQVKTLTDVISKLVTIVESIKELPKKPEGKK